MPLRGIEIRIVPRSVSRRRPDSSRSPRSPERASTRWVRLICSWVSTSLRFWPTVASAAMTNGKLP